MGKPSLASAATSSWPAWSRNSSTSCSRTDSRRNRRSTRSMARAKSISSTGKSITASPCIPESKHGQCLRSDTDGMSCRVVSVQLSECRPPRPSVPTGTPSCRAWPAAEESRLGVGAPRASDEPASSPWRFPHVYCELDFTTPLELAVATILSAQCTDVRVNQVTPALFARYPDAKAYAEADRTELEEFIRSTGFYRNKTNVAHRSGPGAARAITTARCRHKLEDLVKLPGIGRKTANVVLGNAFDVPGITVDTHFGRLVRRWKWTDGRRSREGRACGRSTDRTQGMDAAVASGDLPRPSGLPRAQTRLRSVRARQGLPVLRARTRPTKPTPPRW